MKKRYIAPKLTVHMIDVTEVICTSYQNVPVSGEGGGGRPADSAPMRGDSWRDFENY